jgi:hypothetical protein
LANKVNYTPYLYIEITEPRGRTPQIQNYSGCPSGDSYQKESRAAELHSPTRFKKKEQSKIIFYKNEIHMNNDVMEAVQNMTDGIDKFKAKQEKQLSEIKEDVAIMKDRGTGYSRNKSLGEMAVEALKEAGLDYDLQKGSRKTVIVKSAATMTTGNVTPVGTKCNPLFTVRC